MGAGALSNLTGLSPASLARVLAKLEDEDLIARRVHRKDRRRVFVSITVHGRKILGTHGILRGTVFEDAAERLDPIIRSELIANLETFQAVLEECASDDAGDSGHTSLASSPDRRADDD
jgi:DNA-binding MarR family transcriptional regulator